MKSRPIPRSLLTRLKRVKLFLCDVDGVLTDGTVSIREGAETKTFHVRDGIGLRFLQKDAGIRIGWVSARPSAATTARAMELKVDFLHQAPSGKVAAIEGILVKTGLTWAEVAWMGDDVLDLGALERAGFSAVPGDAMPEAKARAHHVCRAFGGRGAVREVVEMILRAQGHWDRIVESLSQT